MGEKEFIGDLADIDYQKGLTSQLINIIDERIDELWPLLKNSHIDDERIFEIIEHIVGLGFVVLQQYMTVVYGDLKKYKKDALPKGPKHESGNTFAKIVDASADYWKHNGQWPLDTPRNRKGKEDIEAIFETISITSPIAILNHLRDNPHKDTDRHRIVGASERAPLPARRSADRIVQVIQDCYISVDDAYPLGNILSKLSHTEKEQFNAVFKKIQEWRNELNR